MCIFLPSLPYEDKANYNTWRRFLDLIFYGLILNTSQLHKHWNPYAVYIQSQNFRLGKQSHSEEVWLADAKTSFSWRQWASKPWDGAWCGGRSRHGAVPPARILTSPPSIDQVLILTFFENVRPLGLMLFSIGILKTGSTLVWQSKSGEHGQKSRVENTRAYHARDSWSLPSEEGLAW